MMNLKTEELRQYLMNKRDYTNQFLDKIEQVTTDSLMDIDLLADLLQVIYLAKRKITILPDFDMDGIMSAVVGYAGMSDLGFEVSLYEPDPGKGYGFDASTIDDLLRKHPGTESIITCDTGITCYEGVAYAKSLGLTVLVTDHHLQKSRDKLQADVIVDAKRIDDMYETSDICGAYTLWKCLHHYATKYRDGERIDNIEKLRVFASIGTVSDVMPVLYENRKLLKDGITWCNALFEPETSIAELFATDNYALLKTIHGHETFVSAFYGLYNLLQVLYETGKFKVQVTEELFGFYVAPMFNSLKRLEKPVRIAYDVFFNVSRSLESIDKLMELNERRKQLVDRYYMELKEQLHPYEPYIYISQAPAGILGVLATKVMEETGLPTMVVRQDKRSFHGSGRSPEWYPCNSRMTIAGFHLAGHEGAFGVGFTDKMEVKSAVAFLEKDVIEVYNTLEVVEDVEPELVFGKGDIELSLDMMKRASRVIESFRPFGRGFTMFTQRCVIPMDQVASMEFIGKDQETTKLILWDGSCILMWRSGSKLREIEGEIETLIVDGGVSWNVFNDIWTLQFTGDLVEAVEK